MARHVTVVLDDKLLEKLRKIHVEKIQKESRFVSLSKVICILAREGLEK